MNNPGFEKLKQVFQQFAAKYNPAQLQSKAPDIRKGLAKEMMRIAIDKEGVPSQDDMRTAVARIIQKELPREAVEEFTADLYNLVQGQEFSEAVSDFVQGLDVSQLQQAADAFKQGLKSPQGVQSIAAQLKMMSSTTEFYAFREQMKMMFGGDKMPAQAQAFFDVAMDNIQPIYESAKDMSVPEIADQINAALDALPIDELIGQVLGVTYLVTPDVVSNTVKQQMAALPSPKNVGAIFDEAVAALAGKPKPPAANDDASKPKKPGSNKKFKF